ncbi:hypothetical protein LPJ59_000398 [Coemansia sp. RSA 2399]|nr:hypothetical protein LPJ59_000398 [Coemansia sp. RSA 2399]
MTTSKLPNNILNQVFQNIVGKQAPYEYETEMYNSPGNVKWVPSQVCRKWREIALGVIYSTCHASIKEVGENITVGPLANLGEIAYIGPQMLEHTNKVNMYVDCQDIFNGKAQHLLLSPRLNIVRFPNANELTLHIHSFCPLKLDCPKEAFVHAIGLCRRLKMVAPKAKSIDIVYASNYIIADTQFGALFQKFIKEVGSPMSKISLSSEAIPIPYARPVDIVGKLTSLVYRWDNTFENTIPLVHMNASTLQSLKIIHACASGLDRLLVLEGTEPAVYPVLNKLEIESVPYLSQIVSKQMFPDFTPFPRLQHLDIQTVYPFADDVLFRKNTQSLEYLALRYDKQLALIFCGAETFANRQYSSLSRVHVRSALESVKAKQKNQARSSMPNNSIMAQFFLDVLPSIKWLKVDTPEVAAALVASISKENVYENVEVLDIDHEINAGEVVRLLKSMPRLSHLVSRYSGIGKKFKDMSLEDVIENMSSRQERLGESMFRKWSIRGIGTDSDFESIATSAFLLAVGCAKFKVIPLEEDKCITAYNGALDAIAARMESEEYRNTAKRLLV